MSPATIVERIGGLQLFLREAVYLAGASTAASASASDECRDAAVLVASFIDLSQSRLSEALEEQGLGHTLLHKHDYEEFTEESTREIKSFADGSVTVEHSCHPAAASLDLGSTALTPPVVAEQKCDIDDVVPVTHAEKNTHKVSLLLLSSFVVLLSVLMYLYFGVYI